MLKITRNRIMSTAIAAVINVPEAAGLDVVNDGEWSLNQRPLRIFGRASAAEHFNESYHDLSIFCT
jgi:hypothetical protein